MLRLLRPLLGTFSWQELRHHPWRSVAAVVAVTLGVALAFSVHLINASALGEFAGAVRSATGEPDLELRPVQGAMDESIYARVAGHPAVAVASPILELTTSAISGAAGDAAGKAAIGAAGKPLRVIGVDALVVAAVAPQLFPVPHDRAERFALFAPGAIFLNPAAQQAFGSEGVVRLQSGMQMREARIAGTVAAAGPPLAVMDIGAAQDFFRRQGELTRIDVRLAAGNDVASAIRALQLPTSVVATGPQDTAVRVDNLSRAYRMNLTVLALVALFTGSFLVYSVLSLSVTRRAQQFALLGVLGLTARDRLAIVLAESLGLGIVGSVLGIALGSGLADIGLQVLGGDLGGGYFPGVRPALQWSWEAALLYAGLGVAAAVAGGWLPARAARELPLAQTLKGLGAGGHRARGRWVSLVFMGAGVLLALAPPIEGVPVAAYVSVGMLLVGGITALPWGVAVLYDRVAPLVSHRVLPLLAVERARRVRESAAVAVSGVVASLSLAVALTVMVASFRESVAHWLDVVLPADLYARTTTSGAAADTAWFTPAFVQAVSQVPGVRRVATQRFRSLLLDPLRPAVALIAREIGPDASRTLPMVEDARSASASASPDGSAIRIYVSEAVRDLYGARVGETFAPLGKAFDARARFVVAGVWRDYVRQSGAIAIERADYQRLTGDVRANDLQVWLAPGVDRGAVQQAIRTLADREAGSQGLVEFASAHELRALSLRIFDRSFAVTYWLQAVAIGIGLFGIAASFSAQVLARRKEFGLLAHLGLTRWQIFGLVGAEGAAWTLIGSVAGLALGLAVSVILVEVVNPQSFHWTMDLFVPWLRLIALCLAVVVAGTVTAWLAGRAAAGRDAVLAVKEDW